MRYLKWSLAAAFLASVTPAHAQFNGVVFFGDSNTDSGRYLYLPEVKGNPATFATFGGFTTNPGPMWSTALGCFFGLPVVPSDAPTGRPKKEPRAVDHIGPGFVVKPPKVAK